MAAGDRLIYIGPPYGGMSTNTIYKDQVPAAIEALIQKVPEIDWLIVPLSEERITRMKMEEPGTPEYAAFVLLGGRPAPSPDPVPGGGGGSGGIFASLKALLDSLVTDVFLNLFGANVMSKKYAGGAKGDGETDDTAAIQAAIDSRNSWTDASTGWTRVFPLSKLYRGGVVFLPPGIYNVSTLMMKSGIKFVGSGVMATRINPIGENGEFVFDRDNSERWLSQLEFNSFTISPTDEHHAFTDKYATPPNVNGFNFNLTSAVYMDNVNILNIAGTGLELAECYDSYFGKMEIIFTGDESKPAIGCYPGKTIPGGRPASIIDLTNAIHFDRIRVENCPGGIALDGTQNVNKLLREIQFSSCKIENSPSIIRHVAGVTFTGGNITAPSDETKAAFTIGYPGSDTRGVTFANMSYFSGSQNVRWVFDLLGPSTYDFKVLGASVTNLQKFIWENGHAVPDGNMILPFIVKDLTTVNTGLPLIKVSQKLRLDGALFYRVNGTGYAIEAGVNSRITNSDFIIMENPMKLGAGSFSIGNSFSQITSAAHYITAAGCVLEKNYYEETVVKRKDFTDPNIALNTYDSDATASIAPAGYNFNHIMSSVGVNDTYGAATVAQGLWSYFTNPQIKLITTPISEIFTYKIEAVYSDGTTSAVEVTLDGVGGIGHWLTNDELSQIIQNWKPIVSFNMYVKSNTTDSFSRGSCRILIMANIH